MRGLTEPSITFCILCQSPGNRTGLLLCLRYSFAITPDLLHQSAGESPFYLIFGQEPCVPVDFLLGRVHVQVPGEIKDWVAVHRARL